MKRQKARQGEKPLIAAVDIGGTKTEVGMITSHDPVLAYKKCPTDAHCGDVLALDSVSERHGAIISNATPVSTTP